MKRRIYIIVLLLLLSASVMASQKSNIYVESSEVFCPESERDEYVKSNNNSFVSPPPCAFLEIEDSLDIMTPKSKYSKIKNTKTVIALKSNLLYDAISLINFSLEVPMGKHFSLLYYHQMPWWRFGESKNEICLRMFNIGTEARYWVALKPRPASKRHIARDKLIGHFLGIYSESGMWDLQYRRDICHQGEFWSAGLSYGYSMPIGRRLNLELSLSVGYASIPYRGYTPSEDYEILWRDPEKVGRWHYFGLTKAQASLVVPITANKDKKGGRR